MRIENLTRLAEDLVFNIGQQVPYKELHTAALSLLKGMYGLEHQYHQGADDGVNTNELSDEERVQVEKAERKLLIWANNQNSVPAKILIAYLDLKRPPSSPPVTRGLLEEAYNKTCGDVSSFGSNFDQMKNSSEKNHAKIFDVSVSRGLITIWPPVEKYVKYFEKEVLIKRSEQN